MNPVMTIIKNVTEKGNLNTNLKKKTKTIQLPHREREHLGTLYRLNERHKLFFPLVNLLVLLLYPR